MLEQYDKKKLAIFVGIPLLTIFLIVTVNIIVRTGDKNALTKLDDKKALGVVTNSQGTIYFDLTSKKFVQIKGGKAQEIMALDFEPFRINYNADFTKALLIGSIDDPNKGFEIADFTELKRYVLNSNSNIVSAQFAPDGSEIVAQVKNDSLKSSYLAIFDTRGVQQRAILNFKYSQDLIYGLYWFNQDQIVYLPITPELSKQPLTQVDVPTGISSVFLSAGPYLDLIASPDRKKIALIKYELNEGGSQGSFLSIFDLTSGKQFDAGSVDRPVETNSQQIAWASDSSVIYAITTNKNENQVTRVTLNGQVQIISDYKNDLAIYQTTLSADNKELWVVTRSGLNKFPLSK